MEKDNKQINILYLINYSTFITKMSRVRIHAMNTVGKLCNLEWWGVSWPEYDNEKTVQENLNIKYPNVAFDLVVSYKPLELKEFCNIKYTKCITYNEMYDFPTTLKEIEESDVDLVICHHENDMKTYQAYYSNYHAQKNKKVQFVHIPHSAEQTIFKDYGLPKIWDVLVVGRLNCKNTVGDSHYPLRDRMAKLMQKMPSQYKCGIYKHPKSSNADSHTDRYLIEFAQAINSTKIAVSCSGLPKSRFGKYIEVPMCNTVHCADLPHQDQVDFSNMLIEININMTDDEIINKLVYYLKHENELNKLRDVGYKWSENYTQELYAERFMKVLSDYKNNNLKIKY